jgi:hypothetical protein
MGDDLIDLRSPQRCQCFPQASSEAHTAAGPPQCKAPYKRGQPAQTAAAIKSITPQLLLAALRVPVKTQKLCHNKRHHVESTSSKWYGLPLINVCNT